MLAVVGTIPNRQFPLVAGTVTLEDDTISIQGNHAAVNRGTPALLAAAIRTLETLGQPAPFAYLAGDIGLGDGSRRLYAYLNEYLSETNFHTIAFHYVQPDVQWHDRILSTVKAMLQKPVMIADAGYMYAAKMSGQSHAYHLFTPDIGELAFLADEDAPHPFYTRGFILHEENQLPDLIARAYAHENASRYLLVKGIQDYVASQQGIQAAIDTPMEETMEVIGGTGDTLTGIVAALSASGMDISMAAIVAARVNRLAGHYAQPTPGTQVTEIIRHIPRALTEILQGKSRSINTESNEDCGMYRSRKDRLINPEMTVLDIVHQYRQTEDVFRKYDGQAGVCICCEALFEPLRSVAERYGLDLETLLAELHTAIISGDD